PRCSMRRGAPRGSMRSTARTTSPPRSCSSSRWRSRSSQRRVAADDSRSSPRHWFLAGRWRSSSSPSSRFRRCSGISPSLERRGDPTPLLPIFFALELLLTFAVLAVALRWSTPTLGAAALAASGAILVPLLLSRWTTQPYYVYVGAIVACGIGLLNARVRSV